MLSSNCPAARNANPRLYCSSASSDRRDASPRSLSNTPSRSAVSAGATGAAGEPAAGRLNSFSTMLKSTSTLSEVACAEVFAGVFAGVFIGVFTGGDSKSPRMLSRSIAFALSSK